MRNPTVDNPEALPNQVDASGSGSAQAGRQIARAAGIVMVAYVLSTLVGVVRGMTMLARMPRNWALRATPWA